MDAVQCNASCRLKLQLRAGVLIASQYDLLPRASCLEVPISYQESRVT